MTVEIQIKSGHRPWAKREQVTKQIDLAKIFSDYWTTKERELTQLGWSSSQTSPLISDAEAQRSLMSESTVALYIYDFLQMLPFVSLQLPIAAS